MANNFNNNLNELLKEQFQVINDEVLSETSGGGVAYNLAMAWSSLTPFFENTVGPIVDGVYGLGSKY